MTGTMKQIVLASYAKGNPKPSDFRLEEVPIPTAGDREILLRTLWLAVDPLFRFAIDEVRLSGALHLQLGDVMAGATVSEVVASNHPDYKPGDIVVALTEDGYTLKYLRKRGTRFHLEAANENYPDIHPREGQIIDL